MSISSKVTEPKFSFRKYLALIERESTETECTNSSLAFMSIEQCQINHEF
jgi:hypothetical protein